MTLHSEQGGAEQFPLPNAVHYPLPSRFTGMATREIIGEYPYVWDDGERNEIYSNMLFTQPEPVQRQLDAMRGIYIYPPDIASHIDALLNFSTPSIQAVIQKQNPSAILDRFENRVLHLRPQESSARSWVSASGFTQPGRYPEGSVADALHTTPEKLRHYLGGYATDGAVMAQTGNFFTQLATMQSEEGVIHVGNTREVNQLGHDLVDHLRLRYFPAIT